MIASCHGATAPEASTVFGQFNCVGYAAVTVNAGVACGTAGASFVLRPISENPAPIATTAIPMRTRRRRKIGTRGFP